MGNINKTFIWNYKVPIFEKASNPEGLDALFSNTEEG